MAVARLSTADIVSSLQNALQKFTPPKHIPNFWIIDTQENCLVPGNSVDKYVALSYVWTSPLDTTSNQTPAQRLMLQRDKLDDFRKPGFLSSELGVAEKLPKVIRDSLWVDCLCIPQNDETTCDNVLSMRDIYSGAHFTIIAAAESSGLYGSGAGIDRVKNIDGLPGAGSLHGALMTTHWATRGWTFQEQMLSTRSLVFLNETAFWDCQGDVWWLYMELICRYNHRNLTYAQDALPAISGVFDALTYGFSGGFISGLPAIFLDSALLWQPFVKAKRRVCSEEKPESSPPLPSWSWAGWQCLIDPASLESGLDYEIRGETSRRTRKLVDWVGSTTVADECKILEPGILEHYKGLRDNPSNKDLPNGWSYKTEDTDSAEGVKPYTPTNRPNSWYSHDSDAQSIFRYPLPMTHVPSTVGSQGYKRFLSCTTSTATFNVRRVLYPHQRAQQLLSSGAMLRISVLDTQLYKNEPEFETYCPVITLEDEQGRWAGLLRVMNDNENIKAQQTVELIAISQGSSSFMEAAVAYEETVDRLACYQFRRDHCHFALTESFQQKIAYFGDSRSECYKSMEKEADERDQGPFFLKNINCYHFYDEEGLPKEWRHENYDFYNVLWVERRGDFMERKAAGRVPKAIWEQNQGALQSIKLG
ncbi:heterokaryon incompatibility protein-domain-containing protein [Daldinia decipiens]|uniref:heterokaryon incompatibility protein-domain-containing protein n=1 Tax=Daldinia decipiens TaxID=326647 RepID=UPI0020C28D16|nr:heterokaryon incompatibility protein-domain-containing protein [Daldinia decipiens]KAI1659377.1 heterokaryon incompatibility protein-domain-containing protein [Daldinia decipiens]